MQQTEFTKAQRVSLFEFFGSKAQNSHFLFCRKKFSCLKRVSLHFFRYLATNWTFKKPKGSPFYNVIYIYKF